MRATKVELAALASAADFLASEPLKGLYTKLTKVKEARPGPVVAQIEGMLVSLSDGRVVPTQANDRRFWIIQQNTWAALDVSLDDVALVAKWIAGWPRSYTTTISGVAKKWPDYLAKARAQPKAVTYDIRRDYTPE